MNSIDYLDLLMSNQKEVKDGFKFLNLKTKEQATIEDCYETIKKDLEILDIIKKWSFIQENYKDGYGSFNQFLCNIHTIGMEEDFRKVKEWLGDD